jgi:hypothetical protein
MPTVRGCEGVNFLCAFESIPFVSRPDGGQIIFIDRARLLAAKTFFNAFFEHIQATLSFEFQ